MVVSIEKAWCKGKRRMFWGIKKVCGGVFETAKFCVSCVEILVAAVVLLGSVLLAVALIKKDKRESNQLSRNEYALEIEKIRLRTEQTRFMAEGVRLYTLLRKQGKGKERAGGSSVSYVKRMKQDVIGWLDYKKFSLNVWADEKMQMCDNEYSTLSQNADVVIAINNVVGVEKNVVLSSGYGQLLQSNTYIGISQDTSSVGNNLECNEAPPPYSEVVRGYGHDGILQSRSLENNNIGCNELASFYWEAEGNGYVGPNIVQGSSYLPSAPPIECVFPTGYIHNGIMEGTLN